MKRKRDSDDSWLSSIRDHALDLVGGLVVIVLLGAALIAYL